MKGGSKDTSRGQRLVSDGAYLRWFAGDTAGELGGSLRSFVIPLATLMATGDTRFAGIVAFAGTLSLGVSDLVGGYLADKHNRIKLLAYGAGCGLFIAGT